MDNKREKIRTLIGELLLQKGFNEELADDKKLVTVGHLDSVDIMDIVVFLEQEFELDFIDRGIDQTEFESVNSIIQMIDEMSS